MQPTPEEFAEWREHPVTEWVVGLMTEFAGKQQEIWAAEAWASEEIDQTRLLEAKVRADCYVAIPESSYEDWKEIDDSTTK